MGRDRRDTQGFAPLFRMITDRIEAFLADKGYDADAIREEIADADIEAVIPAKSNRREPVPHGKVKYKWRNQIERLSTSSRTGGASRPDTTRPKNPISASSPSQQSNYGYPLSTSASTSHLLCFASSIA